MKGRDERGEEKRSKLLALMLIYTQFIPQVDLLIFFLQVSMESRGKNEINSRFRKDLGYEKMLKKI
jgi:hypothetical protein